MMNTSSVPQIAIVILALTTAVLGYLYYQERQENVNIKLKLPGVEIEKSS